MPRHSLRVVLYIFIFSIVLSLFCYFHNKGDIKLFWTKKAITEFIPELGNAYVGQLNSSFMSAHKSPTPAHLLENGRRLEYSNALHADIRELGNGRFSFWSDVVYFSTSDNTDPRFNGRNYQVYWPGPWSPLISGIIYACSFFFFLVVIFILCNKLLKYYRTHNFLQKFNFYNIINILLQNIRCFCQSRNFRRSTIILFTICLLLIALLQLHRNGFLPFSWVKQPIVEINPETGYSYATHLTTSVMSAHKRPSPAQVLENGKRLVQGNSLHADIRELGKGRFSFWGDLLYFSSSDNSDPRTNGRQYEIYWPAPVPRPISIVLLIITFLTGGIVLVTQGKIIYKKIMNISHKYPLSISLSIIVIPYMITRIPYFLSYGFPVIAPDSYTYLLSAIKMELGILPDFSYRTAGYPLFIWLIEHIRPRLNFIILVQHMLTFTSAMFFILVFYKQFRRYTILAAIGITIAITSDCQVLNDSMLLTESLYSSCLVFSFSFFILAIKNRKSVYFGLTAFFMVYSIYVRPTGMFFYVIFLFVIAFLVYNRYRRSNIITFILTLVILMSIAPIYNYFTYGKFTFSEGGSVTLIVCTSTYLEQSEKFSDEINDVIATVQNRLTEEDREIVFNSWNYSEFFSAHYKYFDCSTIWGPFDKLNLSIPEKCNVYKMVALHAIKSHPLIYFKIFMLNLAGFLYGHIQFPCYLYSILDNFYSVLFVEKQINETVSKIFSNTEKIERLVLREYYDLNKIPEYSPTIFNSLHRYYMLLYHKLFNHFVWNIFLGVTIVLSFWYLAKSRFHDETLFVIFIIVISALGQLLLCSMFSNDKRFSSVVLFASYMCTALLPMIFYKKSNIKTKTDEEH